MKFNYKFKVIRGYIFEKDYIFIDYVDYLYNWKANNLKNSPKYIISKLLLNSLYGRFGMNQEMNQHIITNNKNSLNYYKEFDVLNVIPLNNGNELISYVDKSLDKNDIDPILNISVPIAAAITSYSRVFMYDFKNLKNNTVYYTDTDSIALDKPLDDKFVGTELGKMKLEYTSKKSIFLAPKVYGSLTDQGEFIKIKGSKNIISFDKLAELLYKDKKLEINHNKWYKNISKGNITIKNEIYTLMVTHNKRKIIYDDNNKFIDTSPLFIQDNKIIELIS